MEQLIFIQFIQIYVYSVKSSTVIRTYIYWLVILTRVGIFLTWKSEHINQYMILISTVKSVLRGHLWDKETMAL